MLLLVLWQKMDFRPYHGMEKHALSNVNLSLCTHSYLVMKHHSDRSKTISDSSDFNVSLYRIDNWSMLLLKLMLGYLTFLCAIQACIDACCCSVLTHAVLWFVVSLVMLMCCLGRVLWFNFLLLSRTALLFSRSRGLIFKSSLIKL